MKWDGNLLANVVKDALYSLFEFEIKNAHQMDNKQYADLLKNKYTYSGKSFKNCYVSTLLCTIPNGITIDFLKPFPKELDDDHTIEISWSMAARHIRAWELEKRLEETNKKTVQQQWDETHLCGDYYGEHCEYLVQAKGDTVLNGKQLDSWCPYCTSENKVRKIGNAGMWTGISPKFCPKRKALENKEANMARKLQLDAAITKDMKSAASDSFVDSIRMIDVSEIMPNKENFYEISSLELLADDIEREGLKHNLVVSKDKDSAKYWLKSGHRRFEAVKLLIKEKRLASTKVPCLVDGEKTKAEAKLDLIMLNATQRKYTDAEVMSEYEQLSQTLKELDSEGKGFSGRARENIAKILNISNGQVGKLDNIKHNAAPEVQKAVKTGEMSISTANEVAKLAPEKQKEVIEKKPDISSAEVKKMQDKKPAAPPKTKPDEAPKKLPEPEDDAENFDEVDDTDDDISERFESLNEKFRDDLAKEKVKENEAEKHVTFSLTLSDKEAKALLEIINELIDDNIAYVDEEKTDELIPIRSELQSFVGE